MSAIEELQRLRYTIRSSKRGVLHYNRDDGMLLSWEWPVDLSTGARINPSEIANHRRTHQFLGPCCLCPLKDATRPNFVEAAIFMVVTGEFRGEYVAGCANDLCGYYVFLEHHYTQRGLLIKSYPLRGMLWSLICHLPTNTARDDDELEPPPVTRNGMDETPVAELASAYRVTPLKRTYAMLDITETLDIPTLCAPARREATEADVMKRLDHVGLTEDELKWLLKRLVRCKCSLLLTRGAFPNHRCINRDVIDLTQD